MAHVPWHEGDVIRKLRGTYRWHLADLEDRSGVDRSVIHRIEIGKTQEAKRDTLKKLASAFGWTVQQLSDAVPVQGFMVPDDRLRDERLIIRTERKIRKAKATRRKRPG